MLNRSTGRARSAAHQTRKPDWPAGAMDWVSPQSTAPSQLFVVDGASPPPARTPDDPRVRLVRLDDNVGVSRARNIGISASSGRAVTFLDDDDRYAPHR